MKAAYFIGIVPPQEYMERIVSFQSNWIKQLSLEPHITLKAQGGLSIDKKWIEKVQKVCDTFKPFQVSIGKPKFFGNHILYLSVHSSYLQKLHQEIVREISPSEDLIKQYFELEAYVPHLTLGKEQYDRLSKKELLEMEKLAEKELVPFPEFIVDFIRVYELNIEKQRFEKYLDISLSN